MLSLSTSILCRRTSNECRIDIALSFVRQCPPVVSSFELLSCFFLSALYPSGEYEKCLPPTSTTLTHTHTHSTMFVRLKSEGEEGAAIF